MCLVRMLTIEGMKARFLSRRTLTLSSSAAGGGAGAVPAVGERGAGQQSPGQFAKSIDKPVTVPGPGG